MRRAGHALCAAGAAGALASAILLVVAPGGGATPAQPAIGECYDLPAAQADSVDWTATGPVPCTQPHTFEVTEIGAVPQDVDAIAFARDRCGPLDVWTAVGVNASSAGIVADPVRVDARAFLQSPDRYVCGGVVVAYHGRDPVTLVDIDTSLKRMPPGVRARLQHCASAADGRPARAPAVTVPCRSRPSWRVTAWVLWAALYDDYPGRDVLRTRAAELCGEGARWSVPSAIEWRDGLPRTWCYALRP